ncbi:unnamed protein product, partial [Tilletia laevis]
EGQREKVLESSIHLHRDKEVFDAEAFALFTGLKTAFTAAEHLDSTAIIVFIDNQAVLRALKQDPRHNGSSGSILALTRRELIKWLEETRQDRCIWRGSRVTAASKAMTEQILWQRRVRQHCGRTSESGDARRALQRPSAEPRNGSSRNGRTSGIVAANMDHTVDSARDLHR